MAPIVFRPMQRAVTRIGALRWWVGLVLFLFTAEVRIQAVQPQTQAASVWTGTMQSESTDNVPGIRNCTELWNMNLSLTVAPDGTVAGRGTGEFIGLRGVCNRPDEAQHYTYLAFDVRGRMDGKQFTLQMIWRDVKGSMSPGLLNHTLFFGPLDGPFDPPILRVPIIASDRAEGTSTVKLKSVTSETGTGVHSVQLCLGQKPCKEDEKCKPGVRFGNEIAAAAARHKLDPALLAAIAAQETGGPHSDSGRNIMGDNNHGYGVFQIDDRSHSEFTSTPQAMNPADNAEYAAGIMETLLTKYGGDVHKACSAYNAGGGNRCGTKTCWNGMRKAPHGADVKLVCTGENLCYADSVLRHQRRLLQKKVSIGCHE